MIKKLLFDTWAGCWLLAWLERRCGLAVVDVGEVQETFAGRPTRREALAQG